jgi:hypothetical protein
MYVRKPQWRGGYLPKSAEAPPGGPDDEANSRSLVGRKAGSLGMTGRG